VRRWLKAEARRTFDPPTRALASRLGRSVASVTVADTRSRWGSCASTPGGEGGRIAYSWRLVLAPTHVQRAVIAHEVAHLAVPDHSRRFWDLATDLLGGSHTPARNWLQANGPMLHGIGAR
jgi:predicted metal-dependent hydrolase